MEESVDKREFVVGFDDLLTANGFKEEEGCGEEEEGAEVSEDDGATGLPAEGFEDIGVGGNEADEADSGS